jgi:hypothetical protein
MPAAQPLDARASAILRGLAATFEDQGAPLQVRRCGVVRADRKRDAAIGFFARSPPAIPTHPPLPKHTHTRTHSTGHQVL